jgi:flagellar biosynthesis/type III secretory pathway protein FliH
MPAPTEFTFEALEPVVLAPVAPSAAGGADAVMDALAQAREEADEIRARARAEGLAAGQADADAALAPALAALQAAAGQFAAEQAATAERLEAHAVELALMIADKVVSGSVAVRGELVVESVRGALRGLIERERITVLVHPDDLETMRAAMDGLRASLGGVEHCEVQAERRVGRGGAIVRTPDGDVDARLETKLQRVREAIETELGSQLAAAEDGEPA